MGRWLVTSAWPYINYVPHLGTMIGSVLSADVMARYLRLKGEEVLFVSGSDEHGTPIEVEAIRLGIPPKKLTDRNHETVSSLFKRWGISYDNYTRTESPVHKRVVREICLKIAERGYVFTSVSQMPFCPKCNRHLPDRFIEGICPHCSFNGARGDQCDQCGRLIEPVKLIEPHCTICNSPPTIKETRHWYLDLSRFAEELKGYVEGNRELPDNARNLTLSLLREGLKPRALTRDNQWGIPAPFPEAEGKTIYVWIEAVLGYISAAVEYFERRGGGVAESWRDYWFNPSSKTLYFIGKDNIPFHLIILPALLIATGDGYNLPSNVNSTEFLMFEGEKFSKSRRVGVWIDEALDLFPADYWRHTLLAIRPEAKDANFTWDTFLEKVNADLNDTLGNFIHRTLTFVDQNFGGVIPHPGPLDPDDEAMLDTVRQYPSIMGGLLDEYRLQAASTALIELARKGNKYINEKEPWKTIKKDREKAASTLYVSVQLVKALAILMEPFIPFTAEKVWELLALPGSVHSKRWSEAAEKLPPHHKIGKPAPLFRKIEAEELKGRSIGRGGGEGERRRVTFEQFSELDIRVGKILEAQPLPRSDKLLKLTIDVGEGSPRTAVAGLKPFYRAEELKGRLVAVVANIQPTKIHGVDSEVMVLAAVDGGDVAFLTPERAIKAGSRVG